MADDPYSSPGREPDAAPSTEADPLGAEDVWVTARHAADVAHRPESWVREQCRVGGIAYRTSVEGGNEALLVPLGQVLDRAAATGAP